MKSKVFKCEDQKFTNPKKPQHDLI